MTTVGILFLLIQDKTRQDKTRQAFISIWQPRSWISQICHVLLWLTTAIISTSAWGNGNSGRYTFDCFAADNLIYKSNNKYETCT